MQGFGENVWQFIPCLCSFFSFFFLVEISSHTLIPLYRPGSVHSGSASWDDCEQVFPDDLRVSLFPDSFPHYTWTSSRVSPLRLCWVKGVFMFMCNLPPALLADWLWSFTRHCDNMRVEWTPNKESAHKVDSGEGNSPTAPARIRTHNLSITSPAL